MKIKDFEQKKRVINRLRRIEGQIRGIIQMVEDEENVQTISQQLSATRSAMTHTLYEEFFCALERMLEKNTSELKEKDMEELRDLLKGIR